ncbi:MAG TPA: hypothetical protein VKX31_08045 [Brumimicrobium sp.]|nr:hypothetical protein [Brumimicrobium sp.]
MILQRIRFMKVNRNKRFDYTPRYYDERKERIEKIREMYAETDKNDSTERQTQIRDRIQSAWHSQKSYSKQARFANVRLIVILVALIIAATVLLGYVDIFAGEVIDLDQ